MFSYNISREASKKVFENTCKKIEDTFKDIVKEDILEDVDGSLIQIYKTQGVEIKVYNDYEVDAVYVDSEVEIEGFN